MSDPTPALAREVRRLQQECRDLQHLARTAHELLSMETEEEER